MSTYTKTRHKQNSYEFHPGETWDVEMVGTARLANRWVKGNQKVIYEFRGGLRGEDTRFDDWFRVRWNDKHECWEFDYNWPGNRYGVRGIKERITFKSADTADVTFYWYGVRLARFVMTKASEADCEQ